MTGQEKCDLCNTGDCLIEVATLTGLTVYNKPKSIQHENVYQMCFALRNLPSLVLVHSTC